MWLFPQNWAWGWVLGKIPFLSIPIPFFHLRTHQQCLSNGDLEQTRVYSRFSPPQSRISPQDSPAASRRRARAGGGGSGRSLWGWRARCPTERSRPGRERAAPGGNPWETWGETTGIKILGIWQNFQLFPGLFQPFSSPFSIPFFSSFPALFPTLFQLFSSTFPTFFKPQKFPEFPAIQTLPQTPEFPGLLTLWPWCSCPRAHPQPAAPL